MKWIRGPIIGRGSCAFVSAGTTAGSGHIFAVKSAELSKSTMLRKEKVMLSYLHCPQIISQIGDDISCENGTLFYNLFLEFAHGGSLSDVIVSTGALEETLIRAYTRNILIGLDYLHSNGIVHCDIKGQNILITGDCAKISDFSCAKWEHETGELQHINGTPVYMAPEVARGEQQSSPSDIWSLGCTVIAMATGRDRSSEFSNPISALYKIGFSDKVPEIPSFMSTNAQDFLHRCLRRNPSERWSAKDLLEHDFIVGIDVIKPKICSPANILDGRAWETDEEPATWTSISLEHKSFSLSPIERIRQLADDKRPLPPWNLEGDWFPVREDGDPEEEYPISCHNSAWDSLNCDLPTHVAKDHGKGFCNSKGNCGRGQPEQEWNYLKCQCSLSREVSRNPSFMDDVCPFHMEYCINISLSYVYDFSKTMIYHNTIN